MSNLESHIKPLVEAVYSAYAEFEEARLELTRHNEAIERFEKCREESRQAANEENLALKGLFKALSSPKECLKRQAARNGHLEDAENFQDLINEANLAKKHLAIELSKVASLALDRRNAVRMAAIEYLQEAFIERLPVEYFQLVQLLCEQASAHESSLFNADPTAGMPIDFAIREVGRLVSCHIKGRPDSGLGIASILSDQPSGLRSFVLPHARLHQIEAELTASGSSGMPQSMILEMSAQLASISQ